MEKGFHASHAVFIFASQALKDPEMWEADARLKNYKDIGLVADIANQYEDAAALAHDRGWGDTPYAIFSCVQRYAIENKRTEEKSISEKVWFYDQVTIPASPNSKLETITGELILCACA
jgi:hypothetical protein